MDSQRIDYTFNQFRNLNVLVIGDVMIDAYLFGGVDRISPEAPVPVVSVQKKQNRLGGAANVALNVKALGAHPILCCMVGNDDGGEALMSLLKSHQLSAEGVVTHPTRPTTVKTRVISHSQQMLRIDEEVNTPTEPSFCEQVTAHIIRMMHQKSVDVIIFEDYDKGLIQPALIEAVVKEANALGIPTTVDPKKRNFANYKNVTLFKPNLKELREGLNIDVPEVTLPYLKSAFEQLQKSIQCTNALFTLSEYGMYISNGTDDALIPAHIRNIADVSGAGDTVISVASLAMAAGLNVFEATELANLAGGLVCEKVGVVPINGELLKREAKKLG